MDLVWVHQRVGVLLVTRLWTLLDAVLISERVNCGEFLKSVCSNK